MSTSMLQSNPRLRNTMQKAMGDKAKLTKDGVSISTLCSLERDSRFYRNRLTPTKRQQPFIDLSNTSPVKQKAKMKLEYNLSSPSKQKGTDTPPVIKRCRKKINRLLLKDKSMSKERRDSLKNVARQIASKEKSLSDSLIDNEDKFESSQEAVNFAVMMADN